MGYAEKRGDYWRGRYKVRPGRYESVKDAIGATARFRTRREAEKAANDAESQVRARVRRDVSGVRMTFGACANAWYDRQDLAASTMQNYRRRLEEHLLPAFESFSLGDITAAGVAAWERGERARRPLPTPGRREDHHGRARGATDRGAGCAAVRP